MLINTAADKLSTALSAVAPVNGVSIGRRDDKSTWRIDFRSEATDEHKSAAQAVLAAFDVEAVTAAEVTTERDGRLLQFHFGGSVFDFDATSQQNISAAFSLALAAVMQGALAGDLKWSDPDYDFAWIDAGNQPVKMDAPTVVAFGKAAAEWKSAHIYAARALKDKSPIPADFKHDKYWPAS